MMYHFMFGLRGGSLLTATPSVPGVCSPGEAASFFSSSCMIKFRLRSCALCLLSKIAVHLVDALLNHVIDNEEVHAKDEDRDYNHRRCGLHFFPRGRGDFAHFGAHVVVKRLDSLRPGLQPVAEVAARGCD